MSTATALSWAANDFSLSPALDDFLTRAGLGTFTGEVTSLPGRNAVWIGRTTSGRRVFVKQALGDQGAERVRRQELFDHVSRELWPAAQHPGPRLLASDPDVGLVAFEAVDGRDGASLVIDEAVDEDLASALGQILARVHSAPGRVAGRELDPAEGLFPVVSLLHAVPPEAFEMMSFADVQVMQFLQADIPLVESIHRLHELAAQAPAVPIHGDLRMDQVLVGSDRTYLTDWEDFHLGDPARDVGSFAGEFLYRAVLDIVTDRGQAPAPTDVLTHEDVLARASASITRQVPVIRALWRSYTAHRPDIDPGLPVRATAYAGWHTIDRLFASASRASRLRAVERAAAGIGRSALLNPDRFHTVLGLENPS